MNTKEYQRQYYLKNKQRIKERDAKRLAIKPRVYTPEQIERRKITRAEWNKKNPNQFKQWYEKNKEHDLMMSKKWKADNKERVAVTSKAWSKNNPDKIKKYNVAQYEKNRDERIKFACEYYQQNKSKVNARDKKHIEDARGKYLVGLIKAATGFTSKEIRANKDFMELYQASLLLKREIRKQCKK